MLVRRYILPASLLFAGWVLLLVAVFYPGWYRIDRKILLGVLRFCYREGRRYVCLKPTESSTFNFSRKVTATMLIISLCTYISIIGFCIFKYFGLVGDLTERGNIRKAMYIFLPCEALFFHVVGIMPFSAHTAVHSSKLYISFYLSIGSLIFTVVGLLLFYWSPHFQMNYENV